MYLLRKASIVSIDEAMKTKLGSSSYDSPVLLDDDDHDVIEPVTVPYTDDDNDEPEVPRREDDDYDHDAFDSFFVNAEVILPSEGLYSLPRSLAVNETMTGNQFERRVLILLLIPVSTMCNLKTVPSHHIQLT